MNIRTAPRPEAPRSPALSLRSFSAAVILCLLALGLPPRLEGAVTNGVPVVWGNYSNLLNRVPTGLSNVQAVACGYSHNLALHNDGTVTAWGENWSGETDVPPGLSAVRAISAGRYFSVALRSNGTVVAWGANDGYQTNVPVGLSGVKAIAAGEYHCLALTSNGVVVGWGSGSGASVPLGLPTIIAISAGTTHSMALTSGYRVICWGQDTYGKATVPAWLSTYQVVGIAAGGNHSLALARGGWITGWGDTSHGQTPYNQYLSGVAAIAAGQNHSLVLFSNFTAYAFGDNTASQCILPATLNSNGVAISASGDMSMALTVNPPRITTQPLTNQSVVAGTNVGFTVVASGGAPLFYQWRKNGSAIGGATNASYSIASAQTGDSGAYSVLVSNLTGTTLSSNAALVVNLPPLITVNPVGFPALEGSGPFDLVVGAAGTAPLGYLWRKNGTPLIPLETSPTYRIWIVQADSGGDYTCVVTNAYGAATSDVARVTVNRPPLITNQPLSLTVYAGAPATFTVGASNATSYQWRKEGVAIDGATSPSYTINNADPGQAGSYTVLVANNWASVESAPAWLTVNTLPDSPHDMLELGETYVWNGSTYVDVRTPSNLGDFVSLSLGQYHGLATLANGTVAGWGDNSYGQLSFSPPLTGASNAAAGGSHSLALTSGGRVTGAGANSAGQAAPQPGLSNLVAIAAGGNHSLGLRADGTVAGWGSNYFGQATAPPFLNHGFVRIAAGFEHSLALRGDGTVSAWGRNAEYQTLVPPPLTNAATANVQAIAAGGYHCMALRRNGTVVCWGANGYGQTNVPSGLGNVIAIAAGLNHCLALRGDGTVAAWGANNFGQTTIPAAMSGVRSIAAGGNRSLLIFDKQVVVLPPAARPGGGIVLYFVNNDGTPMDAATVSGLAVLASANLTADIATWTRYTNGFVLVNGMARWEDPAAGLSRRYYRTVTP